MKVKILVFCLSVFPLGATLGAHAQSYAATDGYRVCAENLTQIGIEVVQNTCGSLARPDFSGIAFSSLDELLEAQKKRDAFHVSVSTYSDCVNRFVESFRRPGAPADSDAPDRAACAHSWAQDQATASVRDFGRACIAYADRSLIDRSMETYDGECYLSAAVGRG